ncbi:MAG: hypothetical protein HUJ25_12400 [Crocinitomicaceae bacterium]|nr:hypothetical protein [Crocinitomicaceae bacterium]
MTKTDKHKNGVAGVIYLARFENNDIGDYSEHFINKGFGYAVRLSNGVISMSKEVALDYETNPQSITRKRILKVVDTFMDI